MKTANRTKPKTDFGIEVRVFTAQTGMTVKELAERLLTRLEAQGENMSTERAEFGVLMVDCAMHGCGADLGMKGDGSNGN